ncbi:hypothetical protein ASF36_24570 [Methylobacterium sp. Leaf90]|nr:hypothetical protein ASF36_24570 [Methylobacterium sp. Leaf90]
MTRMLLLAALALACVASPAMAGAALPGPGGANFSVSLAGGLTAWSLGRKAIATTCRHRLRPVSRTYRPLPPGPREAVDLMRELRDLARRQTEDTSRIAECVRIIREDTVKHTGLLDKIEQQQAIENRSHERER